MAGRTDFLPGVSPCTDRCGCGTSVDAFFDSISPEPRDRLARLAWRAELLADIEDKRVEVARRFEDGAYAAADPRAGQARTAAAAPKDSTRSRAMPGASSTNPQHSSVGCKSRFYLVTYDYSDKILHDIRQKDRPTGLADVQDDYEVWVKSWGEILDAGEKRLRFFQEQLNYEATDDRVTRHLRESYSHLIPESRPQDVSPMRQPPTSTSSM